MPHNLDDLYDKLSAIEAKMANLEGRLCTHIERARSRRESISTAAAAAGAATAAITILLHYTG